MTAGDVNSPVFSFTSLDYSSVINDLIRFAQTTFPASLWTDFNDSNQGTFFVQLMAYATDLLAYTANSQALETIITTCVREQNFRNIAKSFDYTMKSASPSSAVEQAVLNPSGVYPFTISSHLQLSPSDGTIFQPVAPITVSAYPVGGLVQFDIVQGAESFNETVATSTGQPGQSYTLHNAPLIDGTLSLSVGLSSYTQVTNFIASAPTDTVYMLETDENGVTTVLFGDGINGIIPPTNQVISATYKTGGGSNTNYPVGVITRLAGTSDGSPIPPQILSVTNITAADDGGPKQTLTNAKQNLPLSLKANDRAVTEGDYAAEAVALVAGVFAANAVAGPFQNGSFPIYMFVVPNGVSGTNPAVPTDVLRNQIIQALRPIRMAGKRIRVFGPQPYVYLTMTIDVFVSPATPKLTAASRIQTVVDTNYSPQVVSFGQTFEIQDAYNLMSPTVVPGISRVFLRVFSVLPYASQHINRPATGNGTAEGIVTTPLTQRREWYVLVIPANPPTVACLRFSVLQRQLGTVTSVTDTQVTDEAAAYATNGLIGANFVANPDLTLTQFGTDAPAIGPYNYHVSGNTGQTINTNTIPGYLLNVEPGDPYVVETLEPTVGKVLRTTLTAPAVASTSLAVMSSTSFQIGDPIRITSAGVVTATTVANVGLGVITTSTPITAAAGDLVDYVWVSGDGTVQFALVDGTTMAIGDPNLPATPVAFVIGDSIYVDTFGQAGDIVLRDETFPLLNDANINIVTVGGI